MDINSLVWVVIGSFKQNFTDEFVVVVVVVVVVLIWI